MSTKYKVLILAGGGIWGAIPAYFLASLGNGYEFQKQINTLSGSSIGGIEACCFSIGTSAADLFNSFKENAKHIFIKQWLSKINPLHVPSYRADKLSEFIEKFVGNYKINDIKNKYPNLSFFVPCLNMTKNNLKVFDNITGQDDNCRLLDIALCTSAAPTYFPVRNYNGDAITDGGVRENIPILTTSTGIKSKMQIDFKDMDVLVLCTGQVIDKACGSYKDVFKWNLIQWALNFIIPDVTNSNETMSKFWGKYIGFNSFEIFNPVQIKGDMDNPKNIDYILEECKMFEGQFQDIWEKFIK